MGKYKLWKEFIDLALEIMINNPCKSRLVIKYINKKNAAIIKVTDDKQTVMSKLNKEEQFQSLENFIKLASKIFQNNQESDEEQQQQQQMQIEDQEKDDPKSKEKKKKKKNRG